MSIPKARIVIGELEPALPEVIPSISSIMDLHIGLYIV
jgi:hypothetical protein